MSETHYINFSEETENDIVSIYDDACGKLQSILGNLRSELEEICTRTKYQKILDALNGIVDLFNGEIRNKSESIFESWAEGSGCFTAVVSKMEAGDEANQTAQEIESKIRDCFEEFWSDLPLGDELSIDTSRPEMTLKDFEDMKDNIEKTHGEIDSEYESTISNITGRASDNATFALMEAPVKALFGPMNHAFEGFEKIINDNMDTAQAKKESQDQANEEALEQATNTASSAEEIGNLLRIYSDN